MVQRLALLPLIATVLLSLNNLIVVEAAHGPVSRQNARNVHQHHARAAAGAGIPGPIGRELDLGVALAKKQLGLDLLDPLLSLSLGLGGSQSSTTTEDPESSTPTSTRESQPTSTPPADDGEPGQSSRTPPTTTTAREPAETTPKPNDDGPASSTRDDGCIVDLLGICIGGGGGKPDPTTTTTKDDAPSSTRGDDGGPASPTTTAPPPSDDGPSTTRDDPASSSTTDGDGCIINILGIKVCIGDGGQTTTPSAPPSETTPPPSNDPTPSTTAITSTATGDDDPCLLDVLGLLCVPKPTRTTSATDDGPTDAPGPTTTPGPVDDPSPPKTTVTSTATDDDDPCLLNILGLVCIPKPPKTTTTTIDDGPTDAPSPTSTPGPIDDPKTTSTASGDDDPCLLNLLGLVCIPKPTKTTTTQAPEPTDTYRPPADDPTTTPPPPPPSTTTKHCLLLGLLCVDPPKQTDTTTEPAGLPPPTTPPPAQDPTTTQPPVQDPITTSEPAKPPVVTTSTWILQPPTDNNETSTRAGPVQTTTDAPTTTQAPFTVPSFLTQTSLVLAPGADSTAKPSNTLTNPDEATTTIAVATSQTGTPSAVPWPAELPNQIMPAPALALDDDSLRTDYTLISLLFNVNSLGWKFVVGRTDSAAQLFAYTPNIVMNAIGLDQSQVRTYALEAMQPAGWSGDVSSIGTVWLAFVPNDVVDRLSAQLGIRNSPFYTASNGLSAQLANLVDPTFPILAMAAKNPLNNNGPSPGSPGNSGLSANNGSSRRNAIIGVCVTFGAIALGVFAWWIVRAKRRRAAAEADPFADRYGVSGVGQGYGATSQSGNNVIAPLGHGYPYAGINGAGSDRTSSAGSGGDPQMAERRRSFFYAEDELNGYEANGQFHDEPASPPLSARQYYQQQQAALAQQRGTAGQAPQPIKPGVISAPILRESTLNW